MRAPHSFRIAAALLVTGLAARAGAQARDDLGDPKLADGAITLLGAVSWLTLEALKSTLAEESCRWCDRTASGASTLNAVDGGLRRALVWDDPEAAAMASNVTGFGLSLGASFGLTALAAAVDGRSDRIGADSLIIAESMVVAMNFNQMAKLTFQRQRPFLHSVTSEVALATAGPDDNMSFFSGHTTLAFSLAVSAGTVASMRHYRLAPLIWGVGLAGATATGYLRIAADKHYFSDVFVGAAVGSLTGFAIPYFLHRKKTSLLGDSINLSGGPVDGGGIVSLSGAF